MAHKKNTTNLTELLLQCVTQPDPMLSMLDQQCDRAAEPGDPPPYSCSGQLPGRQLCPYAGLCPATPCSWLPVGQQKVHEYEAPGGRH